jgi:K+-sensing histidine kinase KdpD
MNPEAVEAMTSMREEAHGLLICTENEEANGALVSVRDSGPGLDLTSVDRLFEAFYITNVRGVGIGLTVCRSIIAAHGGRMWARANGPRGRLLSVHSAVERDENVPAGPVDSQSAVKRRG